jgi:DNA-directed RNA polymerase sigma subunit (sigma70/sigma32)
MHSVLDRTKMGRGPRNRLRNLEDGAKSGRGQRENFNELSDHLVMEIAREFIHLGIPLELILEQGRDGLKISMDRYDPESRILFTDYAKWWIKYKIFRFLREE